MHAHVGAHAARHELALRPAAGELELLVAAEFARKRQLVLAGDLAVAAALGGLDGVPQLAAVEPALGRVAGQQHLAAHDAALALVVVLEAGAPVAYALGGAVGGRGRGRAALPARYDLAAHVVACHRAVASFPSAARNNSMLLYIAFP